MTTAPVKRPRKPKASAEINITITTPEKKPRKKKVKAAVATRLLAILDASGSMSAITDDTIGSYNSFIRRQAQDNPDLLVTLILFSSGHSYGEYFSGGQNFSREMYRDLPAKHVPTLTRHEYVPSGGTPLYDAIGHAIAAGSEIPTLVMVMTDGQENSSRQYNAYVIRGLIERRKEMGWTFTFLGADLTQGQTVSMAAAIGIPAANAAAFNKLDQHSTMRAMSQSAANWSANTQQLYASGVTGQSLGTQSYFSDYGAATQAQLDQGMQSADAKAKPKKAAAGGGK